MLDLIKFARRDFLTALALCPFVGAIAATAIADDAHASSIAILDFEAGSQHELAEGRELARTIAADLRSSGRFVPLDSGLYADKRIVFDTAPLFPDWRKIGAEYLINGKITHLADGRIKIEFRLWNVADGVSVAGMQYFTTPENLKRLPHAIADEVYEHVTGEPGWFDKESEH